MRKPISTLAVLSALTLAAAACSADSGSTSGDGAQLGKGGTFTFALPADPGALDPATAVLGATNTTLAFAYDTLVYTDKGGKLVSGLADRWETTTTTAKFTLRKDATCADGSKVTPSVVAGSINRVMDPKTKSPIVGVLIPKDVKAQADDAAGTVTLSTKTPSSFLVEGMTTMYIVCGKGAQDVSSLAKTTSGSGPYQLTEAVSGDHYTLKLRKEYAWGPDGAKVVDAMPDTVVLKVVTSEPTAANLLTSGGLTGAQFSGQDRQRLQSVPGMNKQTAPGGPGEFFYHQGDDRPAKALEVRKALTQALNLSELATIATGGTGEKATGLVTLEPRPCRADGVSGKLPPTDAAAAGAALDAAGWKTGPGGIRAKGGKKLSLRILYATSEGPGVQAAMEAMAAQWKKVGVDAKITSAVDAKFADSLFKNGDWDVAWVPVGVGLPSMLLGYFTGPAPAKGQNFAHLNNAEYAKLAGQAGGQAGAGGCPTWTAAESALVGNLDVVPIVWKTQLLASKGATVDMLGGVLRPTSIRMLKG